MSQPKGIIVVTVGAEDYKNLTYPDILIQILRSFLRSFKELFELGPLPLSADWWRTKAATLRHPWRSLAARRRRAALATETAALTTQLDTLFSQSEDIAAEYEHSSVSKDVQSSKDGLQLDTSNVSAGTQREQARTIEKAVLRRTKQQESKRIHVERLLSDFKHLLHGICEYHTVLIFLAVDDFYFIRREDQPLVIDYMHRLCKDTPSYLKVASIKHRSALLVHTDITSGVVRGHEIQPLDLELPLGQFGSVQRFLDALWTAVCNEVSINDPASLFRGDGLAQAVLTSGGVPRDFFGIVKAAMVIARERNEDTIGKLRINEASRQYTENTKIPELEIDAPEQGRLANLRLYDIARFARDDKHKNCFHIDLDQLVGHEEIHRLIDALVDARVLHLISDNTTNARRAGRFAAYLLDVGLYAHPQRRGDRAIDEVRFWEHDNAGRLKNLERLPVYPIRSVGELEEGARIAVEQGLDIQKALLPDDDGSEPPLTGHATQIDIAFPPRDDAGE